MAELIAFAVRALCWRRVDHLRIPLLAIPLIPCDLAMSMGPLV